MKFEFACPWCGADTMVKGSSESSWRFKLPCELCMREMVVTWDGGLAVARVSDAQPLARTDDETVRIRVRKTG